MYQLNTSVISTSSKFPFKYGTLDFMSLSHQLDSAAIIQSLVGNSYSATTPYVLWGFIASSGGLGVINYSAGAVFKGGEIFLHDNQSVVLGPPGTVKVCTIQTSQYNPVVGGIAVADPVTMAGDGAIVNIHNIRKAFVTNAITGTGGIGDVSAFVYLDTTALINQLSNAQISGMASAFGTPTGTFVPVIMSGFVYTTSGGSTMSAGDFFYNGLYYYFGGYHVSFITTGNIVFTLAIVEGLPTATMAFASSVTPSATRFNYSDMIQWSDAVGLDDINAELTAIENELAALPPGAPINIGTASSTFGTNWNSGAPTAFFTIDGLEYVTLNGVAHSTGAAGQTIATLPTGYRPTETWTFPCVMYDGASTTIAVWIEVQTDGTIKFFDNSQVPGSGGYLVWLSSIKFIAGL